MPSPDWPAPAATERIEALVTLPGSKSLTNRFLVLAALANGTSRLRRPLRSRDTLLMAEALRSLGAGIDDGTTDSTGRMEPPTSFPTDVGGDLWRFPSTRRPAELVSADGVGNWSNVGIRNLLATDQALYVGTANPANLLTARGDKQPNGGWELLSLRRLGGR